MAEITEEIERDLFRFLHALNHRAQGNHKSKQKTATVGDDADLSAPRSWNCAVYLFQQGLVNLFSDGTIFITQAGSAQVTLSLADPTQRTERFAPASSLLPAPGSVDPRKQWKRFVTMLRELEPQLGFNEEMRDELNSNLSTIEAQLTAKSPKKVILQATLESILEQLQDNEKAATALTFAPQAYP